MYTCGAEILCASAGNQERRTADDWLVIQPEDVADMNYRTVSGDTDAQEATGRDCASIQKAPRDASRREEVRLSKTSSVVLPAKWSAGEGSTSLQIWSKAPKLDKSQIKTITNRTPVYCGYPEGPAKGQHRLRAVGSASEMERWSNVQETVVSYRAQRPSHLRHILTLISLLLCVLPSTLSLS